MKRMRYECSRTWRAEGEVWNEKPREISKVEILAELDEAMVWVRKHLPWKGKISVSIQIREDFDDIAQLSPNKMEELLNGGIERRADSEN